MSVLGNPVFVQEKWEHDQFCNGEGEIVDINKFTREVTYRDCAFCLRMEAHQQAKQVGRLEAGDGDQDITRNG